MHRDLDESVADFDLTQPLAYRQFLQANAAALIGIEALLERAHVETVLPDWQQRARTAAITADLQLLNSTATPFELRRAPPTTAEMFGMLYVLEGSRLGSRVMLKQVLSSPDASVRRATSYLSACEPHLWQSFLDTLENADEVVDGPESIGGATYAFAIYRRSFMMLNS